jgi:hypothetical protein
VTPSKGRQKIEVGISQMLTGSSQMTYAMINANNSEGIAVEDLHHITNAHLKLEPWVKK